MSMDAIIITGAELRAWGFDEAPDGDYLAGEWILDYLSSLRASESHISCSRMQYLQCALSLDGDI